MSQPLLRIHQSPGGGEHDHQVELTAEDIPGLQRLTHRASVSLDISGQDREDIRWYLEDYLEFDQDPLPVLVTLGAALRAGIDTGTKRSPRSISDMLIWNFLPFAISKQQRNSTSRVLSFRTRMIVSGVLSP